MQKLYLIFFFHIILTELGKINFPKLKMWLENKDRMLGKSLYIQKCKNSINTITHYRKILVILSTVN